VPTPTLFELEVRYTKPPPSIQAPAPPVSSDPQVKTPPTVSRAVHVPNVEEANDIPAPDTPALKVMVSLVLSPRVVLPVTETLSAKVRVPVEFETLP
jgi:hypothetical protein